jgi:hypothetical protein
MKGEKITFNKEIILGDFKNNDKVVGEMASHVIKMEENFDGSTRGLFLDKLVSNYMLQYNEKIIKMFDTIYNEQKEIEQSYGDDDSFVRKIIINNDINKERRGYSLPKYRCLLLNDNCGSTGTFIIIESETSHELAKNVYHRVYKCFKADDEDIKEINLSELKINYYNYIVSYMIISNGDFIAKTINLLDFNNTYTSGNIMRYYHVFKDLVQILNESYYGYNNNNYID